MTRYAVYWDTSAIVSAVIRDAHTTDALAWHKEDCAHLMSTLAYAETCSVLSRLHRENVITGEQRDLAIDYISSAPWLRVNLNPEWDEISEAAKRCSLRGADLWHLAMILTLKSRGRPDLRVLTYDDKLKHAAEEMGLVSAEPH